VGVTLWESQQAMIDSRERADQLRQQAAEQAQDEIESVIEYRGRRLGRKGEKIATLGG
jgi:F0F1-type ATP synthase membrane subunit b/b'